jgi:hypothetical protein
VLPKDSKIVTFDYLLPASVGDGDRYHLTWVRQVGTARDRLRVLVGRGSAEVGTDHRTLTFERSIG